MKVMAMAGSQPDHIQIKDHSPNAAQTQSEQSQITARGQPEQTETQPG